MWGGAPWFIRLQADPRFRSVATRLPVFRIVARHRAGRLFELCAGFVYSQILSACIELDVPSLLLRGGCDASALGLTEERAERLLAAAASLGIAVRRRGGGYGLGPMGAALINNPGVVAMIAHHRALYDDLRDPVGLLRDVDARTALRAYWSYGEGVEQARDYSDLMAASQRMIADEVLGAYSLRRHRRLLDVGGGTGAFAREVERRAPWVRAVVFDLPSVAALARGLIGAERVVEGDFRRDSIPEGADIITLVRVLHDHDDEVALTLLRAVRRALPAGGRLLVAEPMAETPGAEAAGDGYFGFYLLAMGSGRPRSPRVIRRMIRSAGFTRTRLLPTRTPLLARVIVAE